MTDACTPARRRVSTAGISGASWAVLFDLRSTMASLRGNTTWTVVAFSSTSFLHFSRTTSTSISNYRQGPIWISSRGFGIARLLRLIPVWLVARLPESCR